MEDDGLDAAALMAGHLFIVVDEDLHIFQIMLECLGSPEDEVIHGRLAVKFRDQSGPIQIHGRLRVADSFAESCDSFRKHNVTSPLFSFLSIVYTLHKFCEFSLQYVVLHSYTHS